LIAPSFADIFRDNCFKNGILPISLPLEIVGTLFRFVESQAGFRTRVDLAA
jgi:3-isopropylmalate/(R)-2-methylmalate dehydratase small subunit